MFLATGTAAGLGVTVWIITLCFFYMFIYLFYETAQGVSWFCNDVFTFVSDGVSGAGQNQLAAAQKLFRSISSLLTFSQLRRRVCASAVPMGWADGRGCCCPSLPDLRAWRWRTERKHCALAVAACCALERHRFSMRGQDGRNLKGQ